MTVNRDKFQAIVLKKKRSELTNTDFQFENQVIKSVSSVELLRIQIKTLKKTLWPLFMDGVQQPQDYSHFEETVYFFPFSSHKFLVLILSTSEG